jgi:Mitochondrial small ribosomal subunit Rsm22
MPAHEDLLRRVPSLLRRARALLGLGGGPDDRLAPGEVSRAALAVATLHDGLIGERTLARSATYADREHLGAYLLWWWPQSYAKVRAAWELARIRRNAPLRVLDVGSGPAPGALALLDAAGGEATAIDASALALAEASGLSEGMRLQTIRADVARGLPRNLGTFDVVVAANMLSELGERERDALLDLLPLGPGGVALFVEPALRLTGRALLAFRDRALVRGYRAVAPCLTQKPCPALASPRDWCTAARWWEPPRHVVQLADATGLRADEELSYAPLVLARSAGAPQGGGEGSDAAGGDSAPHGDRWRVVGFAPPEKGKKRLWVCNDAGRVPLVRLDRDRSPANAALDDLERGDLVRASGVEPRGDGLRVGAATSVERG